MSINANTPRGKEPFHLMALAVLCLILFFYGLGDRPLWDPDEGLHASVAREMVKSGDWVTPRFNGENFYDKPILYYWLNVLSFLVLGINELAARLPAALLGVGGVAITCLLGQTLFGRGAGLLGGMVLATSLGYVVLSRAVVHDISLAFFITLSLLFFYWGYQGRRHRRGCYLLFFASAGMAAMAKGPIGLLLPALVIGLFLLSQGELRRLKEMELPWGLLVFSLITLPWYVLIGLRNREFVSYFFLHQNLGRFFSPTIQHSEPFYFYFPILMLTFFPWSCFLPAALVRFFPRSLRALRGVREEDLFILIWFSAIFIFFSLASSKLATYLLPLFPPAALLVGRLWQAGLEGSPQDTPPRGLARSIHAYSVATLLMALGFVVYLPLRFGYFPLLNLLLPAGVLIGGGAAAYILFFRGRRGMAFLSIGIMVALLLVSSHHTIFPVISPYRSTKGLSFQLVSLLGPEEEVVFFHNLKESVLFYTDRRARVIKQKDELFQYLDSDRRVYCLMKARRYQKLGKEIQTAAEVIAREGEELLLANRSHAAGHRTPRFPVSKQSR